MNKLTPILFAFIVLLTTQFALGANAGFRIDIVGGLYLTPWLGVAYAFGADDVTLDGKTFAGKPLIIFPALHLGFHLR